jgi:hypothetical protein
MRSRSVLPQRGHRTLSPFVAGRGLSLGGLGGRDFGIAKAPSMGHRLSTKTGELQSLHVVRTSTQHASAASTQALLRFTERARGRPEIRAPRLARQYFAQMAGASLRPGTRRSAANGNPPTALQ